MAVFGQQLPLSIHAISNKNRMAPYLNLSEIRRLKAQTQKIFALEMQKVGR